jgi:hypothetical protein
MTGYWYLLQSPQLNRERECARDVVSYGETVVVGDDMCLLLVS